MLLGGMGGPLNAVRSHGATIYVGGNEGAVCALIAPLLDAEATQRATKGCSSDFRVLSTRKPVFLSVGTTCFYGIACRWAYALSTGSFKKSL